MDEKGRVVLRVHFSMCFGNDAVELIYMTLSPHDLARRHGMSHVESRDGRNHQEADKRHGGKLLSSQPQHASSRIPNCLHTHPFLRVVFICVCCGT